MSTKNKITDRYTPFGKFPLSARSVASRTSYVSVVYFHYTKQNFGIPTNTKNDSEISQIETENVTKAIKGVIEEEVASMNISKSVDQASGTFQLQLFPTKNWKQILSPGDWVMIYMYDSYGKKDRNLGKGASDTKNLLMLANIDRISRSLQKNEDNDKVELRYIVSGRSFGKVFEKSDIWFNPYANQVDSLNNVALVKAGLEFLGSPDEMVQKAVDVFLGPGAEFSTGRTPSLNTWKIPAELARTFGSTSTSPRFYDILQREIEENLPGFKARQMLTLDSNGSLHEFLKRSCNELTNELFYEEVRSSDGLVKPTLILKPKPLNSPFFQSHFGKDGAVDYNKSIAALNNKIKTMQELAKTNFVEISPAEVKYEDLGRDDHSRFNLYWLKTSLNYEHALADPVHVNRKKGIANPTFLQASIERYGLSRFDQVLEFCYTKGINRDAIQAPTPNIELWRAFIAQLYDMNFANHLYDAGTIECTGVLEAELGKALIIQPDSNQKGALPKVYYIEGYEHNWRFPSGWTTTFTVTHGQFKVESGQRIFIDASESDFGQADVLIDSAYLSKTNTDKDGGGSSSQGGGQGALSGLKNLVPSISKVRF